MHALSVVGKNELQELDLGRTLAAAVRKHTHGAEASDRQSLQTALPAHDIAWLDWVCS